ncbi:MAG: Crp/Fnr family transcriptional regulator [Paramuribaculum sp.]|nr:Crp/Fnr family transcriptional regulator [Paramuribaculum sp.]
MYEILMRLPIFNGVTYSRLEEVVGNTKFHFLKYLKGDKIIEPGEQCTHIKFIISGSTRVSIVNADGRFKVSQTLSMPDVIAPEYLFGKATRYPISAIALEPTGILQIEKQEFLKILNTDPIFLINMLNLLSVTAQRSAEGVLALTTGSLEERIAFWIVALTQRRGTDIVLSCRQRDLYSLFGVQRTSFIATLDDMKERGLIDYTQHEIMIKSRADMLSLLASATEE